MPGLQPTVVSKKVESRPREIMVHIIGNPVMPSNEGMDVDRMIRYWTDEMEIFQNARPDIIVLPEICDASFDVLTSVELRDRWLEKRGNRILDAFRGYAAAHRTYIVYPSYRDRGDGRLSNCSLLIDREGDVVACYDKIYPTVGDLGRNVIPGTAPVVAQTDFGTVGFVLCFDLNFWDLLESYAALRPDVLAFSSYYHGSLMQSVWAYRCQSHFLGSTIGTVEKNIILPDGTVRDSARSYYQYILGAINTNCKLAHLDFNRDKIRAAMAKYGRKLDVHNNNGLGTVLLTSADPDLPVAEIFREFEIETWDHYYRRSRQVRQDVLRG